MATLFGSMLRLAAVSVLALAIAALTFGTAWAQSANPNPAQSTSAKPQVPAARSATADPAAADADSDSADKSDSGGAESGASGGYAIHAALKSFDTAPRAGDSAFMHASETFPAFCKDWQRRLHDRELNNLENISWKDQNGWKTGTYVSYSPVKSCNCKHSTGGVPIGELTYQETEYYLAGRTVEEARHAQPKAVGITNTTEIFRWDKTKWDDGR